MWIQISSGQGPDECCLAVGLLLETLKNECKKRNFKIDILEAVPGNYRNNFKSVLISLEGNNINDFTSSYTGSILWICKSPYRPNHKRKNWFIDVAAFTESEKLELDEKDLKIESMGSSGPGGQNVNKVESAVRVIHLPTGLVATAREERSQYMNRKLAIARLHEMIKLKNNEKKSGLKSQMWNQHTALTRGNPTRIYECESFKLTSIF